MTLGLTQPLTEMSTRNIPTVSKSGSLNILEPSGPVQACTGIAFFTFYMFRPYVAIVRSTKTHSYSFLKVFCDWLHLMAIKCRKMQNVVY